MLSLLTNPQINALALKGKAFRPVEGNTGTGAADTFVLRDKKGEYYLAVFNYMQSDTLKTIDLRRAGLTESARYIATDLWSGARTDVGGEWTVRLGPAHSAIFKLTAK
jgi:hypothetical protein